MGAEHMCCLSLSRKNVAMVLTFSTSKTFLYKINQHCANTPPKVLKKRDNNDYPLTFLLIIPLNRYLISCICAVYGRNTLPSEPLHRDGGNKWS